MSMLTSQPRGCEVYTKQCLVKEVAEVAEASNSSEHATISLRRDTSDERVW
jgi:hypothetical protein